jgi:hypothetical protein
LVLSALLILVGVVHLLRQFGPLCAFLAFAALRPELQTFAFATGFASVTGLLR